VRSSHHYSIDADSRSITHFNRAKGYSPADDRMRGQHRAMANNHLIAEADQLGIEQSSGQGYVLPKTCSEKPGNERSGNNRCEGKQSATPKFEENVEELPCGEYAAVHVVLSRGQETKTRYQLATEPAGEAKHEKKSEDIQCHLTRAEQLWCTEGMKHNDCEDGQAHR
jgi:hypothetical protein